MFPPPLWPELTPKEWGVTLGIVAVILIALFWFISSIVDSNIARIDAAQDDDQQRMKAARQFCVDNGGDMTINRFGVMTSCTIRGSK